MDSHGAVTLWLADLKDGREDAVEQLLPLVYDQLRDLARSHLSKERTGHTLDGTSLVHEAYLRLVQQESVRPESRRHFFAIASHTMRRILVDHARARKRIKRGAGASHVSLDDAWAVASAEEADEILALNGALERLGAINERGTKVVELRYFTGLSLDEAAWVLGLSPRSVQRAWTSARAWLQKEIAADLGLSDS